MCFALLMIGGCYSSGDKENLSDFVKRELAKPGGQIDPIPELPVYDSIKYNVSGERAPFQKKFEIIESDANEFSNIRPDLDRRKEQLENFRIESLELQGFMTIKGKTIALIRVLEENGELISVSEGNYLGLNHGQIKRMTSTQIEIVEIVSNGSNGYVERFNVLRLANLDDDQGGN